MKTRILIGVAVIVVLAAAVAGLSALQLQQNRLPPGLVEANGRIEAERVDVATKYSGRLAQVHVAEGDRVTQGQVLARLDTGQLDARIREAEATLRQAEQQVSEARAIEAARRSELILAERELERTRTLHGRGHASAELLDQRTAARDNARSALAAATARVETRRAAVEAAAAALERLKVERSEYVLHAPVAGRVQYRLARPGEVLGAGARVLTLLDLTDVHMTVFLPTRQAGRLALGGETRIVLDAAEEYVIPARVSFVAAEAQFTPRHVETEEEREKLMFRVKLTVPAALLERYAELVKTGLPGTGYVRLDRDAPWPDWLQPKLPNAGAAD